MTPESVLTVAQQALTVASMLAAPLLLGALATGLLIGVLQAATQINEMTLSFIPKLLSLVLVLMIAGPWMLREIMFYTTNLISSIPSLLG
jgi:flagellar biosynthetic protein FliQ